MNSNNTENNHTNRCCGGCKYTDGYGYMSDPPKVRCTITGDFHHYDDECNCEQIITPIHDAIKYFENHMFIADERMNHTGVLIDECKYRLPMVPGNQQRLTGIIKTGKCPRCNNTVNSDEKFCTHCGQALYWRECDDWSSVKLLTELTEEYNQSIKSNSYAKQNLQNAINVIDITDESSQPLKAAYDLAVKLLEANE